MIELQNVTIKAGSFQLQKISFRVEAGQYAVLMGRTGRGKTTILEAVCGLRSVLSGAIFIRDTDVTSWAPGERQIGYVPQDLALFPTMSVREHLEFSLRIRKTSIREMSARVEELSAMLGISSLLSRRIQGLSGGECQRVALGRALSFRPAVLLMDEPLSALDHETRYEMYELLRSIKASTKVTTLHVTHNHEDAAELADRRLMMEDGKVVDAVGAI